MKTKKLLATLTIAIMAALTMVFVFINKEDAKLTGAETSFFAAVVVLGCGSAILYIINELKD